jgi:hypothetical protein
MKTCISTLLLEYIFSLIFTREFNVVCAWVGGANTTPNLAAHFAKRNTKFGGGGKRGRAKIPSPQPPSFLPARAFSLAREARRQFRSKKVRISSNKRTRIKLSGILPIDSAARSAAENGNTGSPRTARLAKRRFEIPCDFKYLLCPIKN